MTRPQDVRLQRFNQALNFNQRPYLMGILNVTPDSFSDGGEFTTINRTLNHVSQMIRDGADIVDIGGESSRPFSKPVSVKEELKRVIPVIQAIRQHHQIPISIDTTKAEVAHKALEAGADIINDISAFRFDPEMVAVASQHKSPVIIMHMQGSPDDMQIDPTYNDIISETCHFFEERINWLITNGIKREQIIIDPGIGFGKTVAHNLTILNNVTEYQKLGCPVLIGLSRKAFIGKILEKEIEDRDPATAVLSGLLSTKSVAILRVHDILSNFEAIKICQAVLNS